MLQELIQQVREGGELSPAQVLRSVDALVDAATSAEVKAEFLAALGQKGETAGEIAAYVRAFRERSVHPPIDPETRSRGILDVCGTGGDRLNTFNISTCVALVAASAGIPVAKHGNRAITSRCGSADVLEGLGIRIDLAPEAAAQALRDRNFSFFFAPRYHPAFKEVGPARKLCADRGMRTLFNFLGPLLNPASPSRQLLGVAQPSLCEPMARVLLDLKLERAMVVSGKVDERFLDEMSTLGPTHVAEFNEKGEWLEEDYDPAPLPLQPAVLADLEGGGVADNVAIVCAILQGQDRGPRRDAVLLNASAALRLGARVTTIMNGWEMAAELIDSGRVWEKVLELRA